MILSALLLLALASAQSERPTARIFPEAPAEVPASLYPGAFDAPPVAQWSRVVPGPKVNAASHAERSQPVVHGERIYLGTAGSQFLYALSRSHGAVLQRYAARGAIESAPVIDGDRIWFTDTSGATSCYAVSGELLWRHQGTAPIPSSPATDGDQLVLRNVDDLVYALDRNTGEQRWRYQHKPAAVRTSELTLYAAPQVRVAGSVVLVGFSDGSVVSLDKAGGDLLWQARIGEGQYPDIVAPVAARGGLVYASGYTGPLVALEAESASVRWRFDQGAASGITFIEADDGSTELLHPGTDGVLRAFDPIDGTLLWSWSSGKGGALTEPVLTEAGLIVGSALGVLALIDPNDGTTRWTWSQGFTLQGITSAPTVSGRQMLVLSNSGRLYAMLSPADERPAPFERRRSHRFRLAYPRDDLPSRDR